MTEEEKKDIRSFIQKILQLDDAGRAAAKIAVEAIVAKNAVKGDCNERRKEEGSPTECSNGSPS